MSGACTQQTSRHTGLCKPAARQQQAAKRWRHTATETQRSGKNQAMVHVLKHPQEEEEECPKLFAPSC